MKLSVLKSTLFCATTAALALSACAQTNTPSNNNNNSDPYLSQYHWKLQSATNKNNQALPAFYAGQQQPQVEVNFNEGRMGIHGSCNRLGTSYTVSNNTLNSGNFMSTMMACPAPAMAQDTALSQFFGQQSLKYTVQTQSTPVLSVTNSKGETLRFVGEETADTKYSSSNPETIFLAVSHKTQACTSGVQKNNCLLVKEVRYNEQGIKTYEAPKWELFHSKIEGFEHRADTDTVLRVKRYTRQNVPADASKYAYVLDLMVSQASVK